MGTTGICTVEPGAAGLGCEVGKEGMLLQCAARMSWCVGNRVTLRFWAAEL